MLACSISDYLVLNIITDPPVTTTDDVCLFIEGKVTAKLWAMSWLLRSNGRWFRHLSKDICKSEYLHVCIVHSLVSKQK